LGYRPYLVLTRFFVFLLGVALKRSWPDKLSNNSLKGSARDLENDFPNCGRVLWKAVMSASSLRFSAHA